MGALADSLLARAKRRRRPPTYREVARTVTLPVGPLKGHKYDPDSDRVQSYILDQLDSGRWERIFLLGPPQVGGKSTVGLLVPTLRGAIHCRLPVGYGLPTLEDLNKKWAENLLPALKGSGYDGHLPKAGPGARGGRGPTLQLSDPESGELEGMIVFLAGNAYASTVAIALIDELDQFRRADGTPDWSGIDNIFSRANSYGSRAVRLGMGTIEDDDHPIIYDLAVRQSTGTRPWPKCPHCGRHQLLTWDKVSYDSTDEDTARASVRVACEHCAVGWDESDRQRALRSAVFPHKGQSVSEAGEIVGPEPKTKSLGVIWTALDAYLANLGQLAVDHFRAVSHLKSTGDHGLMRKFVRYRLCQPYTGDKIAEEGVPTQLTKTWLAARSEGSDYGPARSSKTGPGDSRNIAPCPEAVDALVVSCDVQRGNDKVPGRLYFLVMGVTAGFKTYDLAWGTIGLAEAGAMPNTAQLHRGLDALHDLSVSLSQEYGRPVVKRGVDVGDRQDEIRQWLARRPDWWAIKGASASMKATDYWDLPDWIYRREQEGGHSGHWWLYFVDVDPVRRQAQQQFLVPPEAPGSAHVPKGLNVNDSLIKHYCGTAEIPNGRGGLRWSEKSTDRGAHPDWNARIDLLDCRTYALAMAYRWLRDIEKKKRAEDLAKISERQTSDNGAGWLGDSGGGYDLGGGGW